MGIVECGSSKCCGQITVKRLQDGVLVWCVLEGLPQTCLLEAVNGCMKISIRTECRGGLLRYLSALEHYVTPVLLDLVNQRLSGAAMAARGGQIES